MMELLQRQRARCDEQGAGLGSMVITLAITAILVLGAFYGYQEFYGDDTLTDGTTRESVVQQQTSDAEDASELKDRNPLEGFDVESEMPQP